MDIIRDLQEQLIKLVDENILIDYKDITCWNPINSYIKYTRKGCDVYYTGSNNEVYTYHFRSGRLAQVFKKNNKPENLIFSDIYIKPIKPIEYVKLDIII